MLKLNCSLIFALFLFFLLGWVPTCAHGGQRSIWAGSIFTFHHLGPADPTQIISLDCKRHIISLAFNIFLKWQCDYSLVWSVRNSVYMGIFHSRKCSHQTHNLMLQQQTFKFNLVGRENFILFCLWLTERWLCLHIVDKGFLSTKIFWAAAENAQPQTSCPHYLPRYTTTAVSHASHTCMYSKATVILDEV